MTLKAFLEKARDGFYVKRGSICLLKTMVYEGAHG